MRKHTADGACARKHTTVVLCTRVAAARSCLLLDGPTLAALDVFHEEEHASAMGIGTSREGVSVYGLLQRCVTPMVRVLEQQRAIPVLSHAFEHTWGRCETGSSAFVLSWCMRCLRRAGGCYDSGLYVLSCALTSYSAGMTRSSCWWLHLLRAAQCAVQCARRVWCE
jgi:hypothetical protein